ncbi:MAG: hypothetical protein AAFX05_14850 [Planctomycetota bacterium]
MTKENTVYRYPGRAESTGWALLGALIAIAIIAGLLVADEASGGFLPPPAIDAVVEMAPDAGAVTTMSSRD